jgi:hypothetical protein
MFTTYGPYDVQQIELIKQDKQRQLAATFTPPVFEGVSVKVGSAHRTRDTRSYLRTVLASVRKVFASAAQPLRRQPGRV